MSGHRLRQIRGERSQTEVAEQAGIAQSLLSALETGEREMTAWAAQKLAPVLGRQVLEMAPDEDDPGTRGYLTTREAGERMKPKHSPDAVSALCARGKIPGAKKMIVKGRDRWMIPENFKVKHDENWGRLSERKKNSIVRKYLDGATAGELSREYGIDPSYPSLLIKRGYPKLK